MIATYIDRVSSPTGHGYCTNKRCLRSFYTKSNFFGGDPMWQCPKGWMPLTQEPIARPPDAPPMLLPPPPPAAPVLPLPSMSSTDAKPTVEPTSKAPSKAGMAKHVTVKGTAGDKQRRLAIGKRIEKEERVAVKDEPREEEDDDQLHDQPDGRHHDQQQHGEQHHDGEYDAEAEWEGDDDDARTTPYLKPKKSHKSDDKEEKRAKHRSHRKRHRGDRDDRDRGDRDDREEHKKHHKDTTHHKDNTEQRTSCGARIKKILKDLFTESSS